MQKGKIDLAVDYNCSLLKHRKQANRAEGKPKTF
jgi:hypothetical protein